jgi:basic membrane lipoprotein Med (substrate-binding protein (PBP1-ABC) superfamily)
MSFARHFTRRAALSLLAGATAVALAACGGNTGSPEPAASTPSGTGSSAAAAKVKVFGAFATPIEEPWDGVIHQALQKLATEGVIDYKHADNIGYDGGMERTLREIATTDKPDIIIGDAFGNEAPVRAVAKDFPDIAFAFGSGEAEVAPNFSVFDNWIHDPAYLAGMLAGGTTTSNTVGVVGGMPVPEVNRIINAFIAGAQSTNPKVVVKVAFINSWFDPAKAKQAALAQVAAGADVLFAERAGVIEAAKEKGLLSIGCMGDQKSTAPESVMASVTWTMEPTVRAVIAAVQKKSFAASNLKDYSFMKNGGSALTDLNTAVKGGIPADLIAKIDAKKAELTSGAFTTPVDEKTPAGSVGGM